MPTCKRIGVIRFSDDETDSANQVALLVVQGGTGLIQGGDLSRWQEVAVSSASHGRLQAPNILLIRPGPALYSTNCVVSGNPVSFFRIFFDEQMLRNTKTCAVEEARRRIGDQTWDVTKDELDRFVG